jgi:hypothetical protein
MLVFNGKEFAKNDKEFINSLFSYGGKGTCSGYYKKTKRGVYLYNMRKELFAFMKADSKFTGIVTAYKHNDGKIYYMNALASDVERFLGLDNTTLNQERELVEKALELV